MVFSRQGTNTLNDSKNIHTKLNHSNRTFSDHPKMRYSFQYGKLKAMLQYINVYRF